MVSPGTVQIRMRPQGRSNYDFYEIKFDEPCAALVPRSATPSLISCSPRRSPSQTSAEEDRCRHGCCRQPGVRSARPIHLRLIGTPTSPTSHTTLRFNRVDALDTDADSRFQLDIVPSTRGGTALKRARMQSDILIWTKLSEAYWESKGRKGYFMRTGSLLQDLAVELSDAPQTVGPIRVVFMDEKFTGQKKIKTKELLGFFRLTYREVKVLPFEHHPGS